MAKISERQKRINKQLSKLDEAVLYSPTKGVMTWDEGVQYLIDFMSQDSFDGYNLFIGTDSQRKKRHRTDYLYITAIVAHRVGRGGIYLYTKNTEYYNYKIDLHNRMFKECWHSLETAEKIFPTLKKSDILNSRADIEIHIDCGKNGQTKDIIQSVVGMAIGMNYTAKVKPDSFASSKIADKHTK